MLRCYIFSRVPLLDDTVFADKRRERAHVEVAKADEREPNASSAQRRRRCFSRLHRRLVIGAYVKHSCERRFDACCIVALDNCLQSSEKKGRYLQYTKHYTRVKRSCFIDSIWRIIY